MRYFQYLLAVFANVTSEWPASRRIDVGGNVGRAAAAWIEVDPEIQASG
jgi:hypothetical protein